MTKKPSKKYLNTFWKIDNDDNKIFLQCTKVISSEGGLFNVINIGHDSIYYEEDYAEFFDKSYLKRSTKAKYLKELKGFRDHLKAKMEALNE